MFSKCSIVSYLRLVLSSYLGDLQPCEWAMYRCILMGDQGLRTYSNPCPRGDEEVVSVHQHSPVHCIPSGFSHEQGNPSAFIHSQSSETEWFKQSFALFIKIQHGQLVLWGLYQWDRDWELGETHLMHFLGRACFPISPGWKVGFDVQCWGERTSLEKSVVLGGRWRDNCSN